MVPLGWALQAAGHEVRVACAPSQIEYVSGAGLTPLPILGGPDPMFKTRLARYWEISAAGKPIGPGSLLHPVTAAPMDSPAEFDFATYAALHRENNLELMRGSCDRVVDFARRWSPDLVVFDPQNVEGVLAARVQGVPAICHLFGVVGTHEVEPGLDIVLEDHSSSFARYAVPEMSAELIDYVIDPCPASAAPAVDKPRLPVRYVAYNGPGGAPDWATRPPESGRPRVLVAWGTSLTHVYGTRAFLAPMLLNALADLDVEVVVTATERDRATLGPLPANARLLEQWSPLRLLMPACDAVIHYGSGGASMTATVCGVPQLALPFSPEQRMNANRLCRGGAGFVEDGFTVTPEIVRERVQALLGDARHRRAAHRLRTEAMSRPTPAELVETLRDIAETAPWRAPGERATDERTPDAPALAGAGGAPRG
jgi:UDP:flavonoid glycosyltransferase YjiC (YdhE family)